MLKKATIHNFQSHALTVVEFDPRFTGIVGVSDAGKSALLRSIRTVWYRGPFYVRHGETDGYSELSFDNGMVRREVSISVPRKCAKCKEPIKAVQECPNCGAVIPKTVTMDRYIVEGVKDPIDKFGVTLPEIILDKMRIREIKFIDFVERLNFSSQHQEMFFIGESYEGGKRNKILSCLIPDSNKIDLLLKDVISKGQSSKNELESTKKQIIYLDNIINKGEPIVVDIKELMKTIESEEGSITSIKDKSVKLSTFHNNFTPLLKFIGFDSKVAIVSKNLSIVVAKQVALEAALKKIERLKSFKIKQFISTEISKIKDMNNIVSIVKKIERLKSIGSSLQGKTHIEFDISLNNNVDELNKQIEKIDKLKTIRSSIKQISDDVIGLDTQLCDIEAFLATTRNKYNRLLGSSKCPLTGDMFCPDCIKKLSK